MDQATEEKKMCAMCHHEHSAGEMCTAEGCMCDGKTCPACHHEHKEGKVCGADGCNCGKE